MDVQESQTRDSSSGLLENKIRISLRNLRSSNSTKPKPSQLHSQVPREPNVPRLRKLQECNLHLDIEPLAS